MLSYLILSYVILYYIISYHIISYHIILYYIILYCTILYYITVYVTMSGYVCFMQGASGAACLPCTGHGCHPGWEAKRWRRRRPGGAAAGCLDSTGLGVRRIHGTSAERGRSRSSLQGFLKPFKIKYMRTIVEKTIYNLNKYIYNCMSFTYILYYMISVRHHSGPASLGGGPCLKGIRKI